MQRLIGVVCVAIIITTPGCAGFGFLAHLVGAGEKIPASYKLADRPTAILVDDPDNALGAPALPGVIANNIRHNLQKQGVLKTASFITQDAVRDLAKQLDKQFPITPIDTLGHRLGADQVIHVEIESATLYAHTRQVTRPICAVRVKVIDVVHHKRLFPPTNALTDTSHTPPGHHVQVSLNYNAADVGGPGLEAMLAQHLAEQTGKKVAKLFYDHHKPPPGQKIK